MTRRPQEIPWSQIGAIAGIIGALATLAVFFIPTADSQTGDQNNAAANSPGPSLPNAVRTKAEASASDSPEKAARALSTLTPTSGKGFVRNIGLDIELNCPSNQSDDVAHDISYNLLGAFSTLDARIEVSGPSSIEGRASIVVLARYRKDGSARTAQVAGMLIANNTSGTYRADIRRAQSMIIRISCTDPDLTLRMESPRLA